MNDFQEADPQASECEQARWRSIEEIDERIRQRTEERVAFYAARIDRIGQRLDELSREWDTERTLETHAAAIGLSGMLMSLLFGRRWLVLPIAVSAFLLQYTAQGWSLPFEIVRRLGIRTRTEIDEERFALKAIRGDFKDLPLDGGDCAQRAANALDAVRRIGM